MIKKIRKNSRCNGENCVNYAGFEISARKRKNTTRLCFCADCFRKIYFEMGQFVAPKSPQNILNKFKK